MRREKKWCQAASLQSGFRAHQLKTETAAADSASKWMTVDNICAVRGTHKHNLCCLNHEWMLRMSDIRKYSVWLLHIVSCWLINELSSIQEALGRR